MPCPGCTLSPVPTNRPSKGCATFSRIPDPGPGQAFQGNTLTLAHPHGPYICIGMGNRWPTISKTGIEDAAPQNPLGQL